MMEFGIFTPRLEAQQCYEWRPTAARDWDRAVEDGKPRRFVVHVLKDGTYYIVHWGSYGYCTAAIDGSPTNRVLPCESLWIKEGCIVYSQPYTIGEPLPQRPVIADSLPNGDNIYVASIYVPNQPGPRAPGYYIVGNGYAEARYFQSDRFHILTVL